MNAALYTGPLYCGTGDADDDDMIPQKITIHRLDSPDIWERDQSERTHSRRKTFSICAALTTLCFMTAMFSQPDAVEDYSHNSAGGNADRAPRHTLISESGYLADNRNSPD